MSQSAEAITEALKAAHKAVKDSGIPKELQAVALGKASDAFLGNATPPPPAAPQGSGKTDPPPAADKTTSRASPDTRTPIGKIAAELKLDEGEVADVFEIDGEELLLTLRRDQLSEQKGPAMRQVALLVSAGRQAAGLDEDRTHTDLIRAACTDLGVLDKNAYRDEMGKLGNYVTSKAKGQFGREFRVTRHGKNEAASLVKRMTGGGE